MVDNGKLLLTEPEATERLGIGRSTLRKLMGNGEVKYIHIGRAIRFPVVDLEAYVERLRQQRA